MKAGNGRLTWGVLGVLWISGGCDSTVTPPEPPPTLEITTSNPLPRGTQGAGYIQQLEATGVRATTSGARWRERGRRRSS